MNDDFLGVKSEHVKVESNPIQDEIVVTRNCNIEVNTNGDTFFIYVRDGKIEVSGYSGQISIQPRAANLVHITKAKPA